MKKLLTTIVTTFLLSLTIAAQSESINWQTDFKQSLALSRETGKPLLLDFTAVWCKPCKVMDEQFWVRADIIETVKNFVAVKLDYDKERSLAGRYRVQGIPYVAFVDPVGDLITYRKGFGTKSVNELNEIFKEMPKNFSALKKAYAAVELKKNDGAALLEIADFYHKSGMLRLSNDYYKRATRTFEINSDAEKRERIAATIGLNWFALEDYKQSNEAFEDYLKFFPAGKYEEVSTAGLAVGYANLGKLDEAAKHLELLKNKFPASKNISKVNASIEEAKKKSVK